MKLIVGLGNPGSEYARTRHNVGFLVVDELARRGVDRTKARILKPDTFMNLSGNAVAAALRQTNMTSADVIVAYDDADLPFGDIRVRSVGSSAGHNGMQSVIDLLGTDAITRVRIGIGRPSLSPPSNSPLLPKEGLGGGSVPLDAWVLSKWSKEEEDALPDIIARAADEIEKML